MVPAFFRCFPALGFLAAAALAAQAADGSAPRDSGIIPRHEASGPVPDGEGELRLAIIVTRHGVRSSLRDENAVYGSYSAQRWPRWEVPPGCLTPHGKRQMELMGAYYRGRYAGLGLLSGRTAEDEGRIFFRSDSDQRTIETALDLGIGLIPGGHAGVHARRLGEPDPLFEPVNRRPGDELRQDLIAAANQVRDSAKAAKP